MFSITFPTCIELYYTWLPVSYPFILPMFSDVSPYYKFHQKCCRSQYSKHCSDATISPLSLSLSLSEILLDPFKIQQWSLLLATLLGWAVSNSILSCVSCIHILVMIRLFWPTACSYVQQLGKVTHSWMSHVTSNGQQLHCTSTPETLAYYSMSLVE